MLSWPTAIPSCNPHWKKPQLRWPFVTTRPVAFNYLQFAKVGCLCGHLWRSRGHCWPDGSVEMGRGRHHSEMGFVNWTVFENISDGNDREWQFVEKMGPPSFHGGLALAFTFWSESARVSTKKVLWCCNVHDYIKVPVCSRPQHDTSWWSTCDRHGVTSFRSRL